MRTARFCFCCVVFPALLLAGCDHDCYEIEIRPEGDGFSRQLTCWHVGGENDREVRPLGSQEIARLAKLYGAQKTVDGGKKHVFTGRFTGRTPADVGGAGSYTSLDSPLGRTCWYLERFRGNDDLESQLVERREAADQLADLLTGWLRSELGDDAARGSMKQFLDRDLRRDLKNLGLYEWTAEAMKDDHADSGSEFLARAALYLAEHGYFSPRDVPAILRSAVGDDVRPLLAHVQRVLARKMGVADDRPLPRSLDFLGDWTALKASLTRHVRSGDLFQQRIARWQEVKKTQPKAEEPQPLAVVTELAAQTIGFSFTLSGTPDALRVKLYCGRKPHATNGQWDAASGAVTWSKDLSSHRALPVFCFAAWSEPKPDFQEAHFGKIVLADAQLTQYVTWYCGLSPAEKQEWDQFVAGLAPGPKLTGAVKAFRFSTDAKPAPGKAETTPSRADTPRSLILERLKP